jgi:hypothetical protein
LQHPQLTAKITADDRQTIYFVARPTTMNRIGILLLFVIVVGCGESGPPQSSVSAEAALPKTSGQKALTDEATVRECVLRWLDSQRKGQRGDEYWDSYTRTLLDSPDLSKYASTLRNVLNDRERAGQAPQPTIHVVKILNAVRSGDILSVNFIDFGESEKNEFRRERVAHIIARIESSKEDGTPIIQDWSVDLFKENGKWGIFDLVKARR